MHCNSNNTNVAKTDIMKIKDGDYARWQGHAGVIWLHREAPKGTVFFEWTDKESGDLKFAYADRKDIVLLPMGA